MKNQPIMNDQFVIYCSDSTTTARDHVISKFNTASTDHTSECSRVDERLSAERLSADGLSCTGELDYPAAKSIHVLSPIVKQKRNSDVNGNGKITLQSRPPAFENTANRVFTKELLLSSMLNKCSSRSLSSKGYNNFDEDVQQCLRAEKKASRDSSGKSDHTASTSTVTSNSTSTRTSTQATVRFSKITIQEYSIQPGENPGGSIGCPLTIGWDPIHTETLDLDVFERYRGDNRRNLLEMKLESAHRTQILKGMGYSVNAIRAGTKSANLGRRDRYETISRLRSSKSQEMLEGFRHRFHNVVTLGQKKRRERKFLAPYIDANHKPEPTESTESSSSS